VSRCDGKKGETRCDGCSSCLIKSALLVRCDACGGGAGWLTVRRKGTTTFTALTRMRQPAFSLVCSSLSPLSPVNNVDDAVLGKPGCSPIQVAGRYSSSSSRRRRCRHCQHFTASAHTCRACISCCSSHSPAPPIRTTRACSTFFQRRPSPTVGHGHLQLPSQSTRYPPAVSWPSTCSLEHIRFTDADSVPEGDSLHAGVGRRGEMVRQAGKKEWEG